MMTPDLPASSAAPSVSPLARGFSKFMRNPTGVAALAIVLVLFLLALVGPSLAPYDPENYFDYDHLNEGPSSLYWFGVDSLGRDVFSRIVAGARFSLLSGVAAVLIGAVVGTAAGLAAGWYEGWIDRITMRVSDVLFAFPGVLLAIAIAAILGGGLINVAAAVAIFSVPSFARLVRGSVLALKHETYVEAARSIGAPDLLILVRHILPGILSVIVVYLTMRIGTAIITASSLSFLGLGAQPPTPEWGAMLNEAREDILTAPHAALFSIGAIFVTVLAFNLLGDALRDALDPKIDE